MENNDSTPKPQTGGLKLMTVFVIVLSLHVMVIGGMTAYYLLRDGSTDADSLADGKIQKSLKVTPDIALAGDGQMPETADKSVSAATTPGDMTASTPPPSATPAPATDGSTAPVPGTATTSTPETAPAAVTDVTPAPVPTPTPDASAIMSTPPPETTASPVAATTSPAAPTPAATPDMASTPAPAVPAPTPSATPTLISAQNASPSVAAALAPPPDTAAASSPVVTPPAATASTTPAPVVSAAAASPVATTPTVAPASPESKLLTDTPPPSEAKPYVVKSHDSLDRIAHRNHISVAQLKEANNLNSDLLRIGQKLSIPGRSKTLVATADKAAPTAATATPATLAVKPSTYKAARHIAGTSAISHHGNTYVVAKGDTLTKIARKFKTTPTALMTANNITDPTKLSIGKQLKIPHSATRTAMNSTASPQLANVEQ